MKGIYLLTYIDLTMPDSSLLIDESLRVGYLKSAVF
jgi:hypothetical protein